jgi:hypothetical protein
MTEQSGTGNSIPGEEHSRDSASTTTVSDASLDKFARIFEASARRWEVIVYPSLLAFIILAAYGFYLIYSMTSDVHRVTEQMDPIVHSMVMVSDNMVRVTDNMTSMTANMNSITNEMVHMGRNFDEGIAIAARMDMKFAAMLPITRQMQYDMDLITKRMLNVTGPMSFMTDMMPMGK